MVRKILALLAALWCSVAPVAAAPASWVVKQGASEIWIFPSGFAASEDDIPPELSRALTASAEVWFETPRGGDGREIQHFIAENGTDAGMDLFSLMSPSVATRLERALKEGGLARDQFVHAKPWWAYVQLTPLLLTSMKNAGAPVYVEEVLKRQLSTTSVPVRSEYSSSVELMQWFASLSVATQLCALDWQIARIEQAKPDAEAALKGWVTGDIGYANDLISSLRRRCPDLARAMVTDRNRAWAPRIREMLGKPGKYVVVVGEGHLTSDRRGLPAILRAAGLPVQRR